MSNIVRVLRNGNITQGYWVVGDDSYTVEGCLIKPFRIFLNPLTDSYNLYHSSQRMHMEQAFGMLVEKWRKLKSPLMFSLSANSQTVICAVKLHKFFYRVF